MFAYENTEQISKKITLKPHKYPKYGKSTTDPTYYEPAASRIANMKKASGVQLEGIYDFYQKDDVEKFNEQNFSKNIKSASKDPRYNSNLLPEEISQITTDLGFAAQDMLDKKKSDKDSANKRINESVEAGKQINESINNTSTDE